MRLHPTKGWLADGIAAGEKNRRRKIPANRQAEKQAIEPERVHVKYWEPTPEKLAIMQQRHIHPRHKRPAIDSK